MAEPQCPSCETAPIPVHAPRSLPSPPLPPAPEATSVAIVGIGASAGGLEALETFFTHMPDDSGIAFIIVTHMDPHATSFLPDLLGRRTSMSVHEAVGGQRLEPNTVIVTPPGKNLTLEQGILQARDRVVSHRPPLPVDILFRSLAEDQEERAIGIILSGTGTDGTLGAKAIKDLSGMVMVQETQSAKFAGMPENAAAAGLADYVLSPEQMPAELLTYVQGPYLTRSGDIPSSLIIAPEVLQDILSLIHSHTGHSFAAYKISTICRRIERRLNLHQIAEPEAYLRYLRDHADEINTLFSELLIGVTAFFRDPDAFGIVATALPERLAAKAAGEPVRVWVAGCSTGEEAYSIAIVLREVLEQLKKPCTVQIFATDLDTRAIDTARLGLYPEGIAADVSPERLKRFFTHEDSTYQVAKAIREMVVFAPHNILSAPPFTQLDVVSCRNVLIYLDANAQQQILTLFHYALRPGGLLFLGASETLGNLGDFFSTQDQPWKLFARDHEVIYPSLLPDRTAVPVYAASGRSTSSTREWPRAAPPSSQADTYLAQRHVPPSVLITPRGDIMHFHGDTGAYLQPPPGPPSYNIFSMARGGLERVLTSAIRAAQAQEASVLRYGVRVETNGSATETDVMVERVVDAGVLQGLLSVTFWPTATALNSPAPSLSLPRHRYRTGDLKPERLSWSMRDRSSATFWERVFSVVSMAFKHCLRDRLSDCFSMDQQSQALLDTQVSLQRSIEEFEATNEQLTSANEELQSTNEEMQSTNEELKTSKEEMQSLNEELHTVNAELRSKVNELAHTNDDMTNLLNSTDVGTLFLDDELRIKRFTSQATQMMALIPSDVGRPISDLTSHLDYPTLVDDAREVLHTLTVQEREVRAKEEGLWYLVRMLPYRTADQVIEGLVITCININSLKSAEAGEQHAQDQLETAISGQQLAENRLLALPRVFMQATVPIILEDSAGCITDLNAAAVEVYGWSREALVGQSIKMISPPEYHVQVDELLARCRRGDDLHNLQSHRLTQSGEVLQTLLAVSPLYNDQGELAGLATIAIHESSRPQDSDATESCHRMGVPTHHPVQRKST